MNHYQKPGPVNGIFQPEGVIITLLAIMVMMPACLSVSINGHPVFDNLYQLFIYGTCITF